MTTIYALDLEDKGTTILRNVVTIYQLTRRPIPDDFNFQQHRSVTTQNDIRHTRTGLGISVTQTWQNQLQQLILLIMSEFPYAAAISL
jgi:hypothetical protein